MDRAFSEMSLYSPLQYGNSDPFNTCAIPIGPYEAHLFRIYEQFTRPLLLNLKQPKWQTYMASGIVETHTNCLQDEAAAYSMLARNSALEHVMMKRSSADISTPLLNYTTKTQAALQRRLALMNGSETPRIVSTIMWSTCYLASAEMIVGSPSTDFHFQALSKLIVRYVELAGQDLELNTILMLVYVVVVRAAATLTRPVLDMSNWFPRLCQETWQTGELIWRARGNSITEAIIHQDVKDESIREIVRTQKLGPNFSPEMIESCHDPQESKLLYNTMRSQELYRNGQMLSVAADAHEKLRRTDLTSGQFWEESLRAYISLSVILWLRLTSTTTFFGNTLFDACVYILPHMKTTLTNLQERSEQKRHREAQFWALFMGVQCELHREHVLEMTPMCGEWFKNTFHDHAAAMQIRTWQQAVGIFRSFLFDDELKPHISVWWNQVFREEM